jgi:hypothetical protein
MTVYAEVILHSRTLHAEIFLQTALGAMIQFNCLISRNRTLRIKFLLNAFVGQCD